jgi:phospholipid/cholesterol/gamma-HCH transport system substrate-binding protein
VEREARYAAVAAFALLAIAAAFAFVWWYSGQGDRRVYQRYEIYFEGSVSGLSQGSPVRYLGVDVGRVQNLSVDLRSPDRVKVLAEVDEAAPLSGATRARLGLLGLTGLLYIDLQVDPDARADQPLAQGDRYPVIESRKGDIEAFLEKLPDLVSHVGSVVGRIEKLLADQNIEAIAESLEHLRDASATLPAMSRDAATVAAELRGAAADLGELSRQLRTFASESTPRIANSLADAGLAAEKLARTAESLERIVAGNEAALAGFAGPGVSEVQQLVLDVREASEEVRELARTLREQPSSLIREPRESGVEIRP